MSAPIQKEQDYKFMCSLLFEKFGKIALTPKETAAVLGTAMRSLEEDRAEAIGIPFTRRNNKEKGQILYPITAIAKTLIDNQIKTI